MKKTNPIWLYLLLALALTGCQSMREGATARDKYADAERSLIVAIDTATAAFQAGQLKGEPLRIVKDALTQAAAALDMMNVKVKAGDTVGADYWLSRLQAALNLAQSYINTRGA